MRLNKKCILSLRSPSKCSFTLSKLRFFGLRKPKTTSFYSTSVDYGWLIRLALNQGIPLLDNLSIHKCAYIYQVRARAGINLRLIYQSVIHEV